LVAPVEFEEADMPASASRTLVVLSLLAESEESLSVARISDGTGISRAALGRLLASLEADDAVRMDESGRYRATARIMKPGIALLSRLRVRDVGFPLLADLSREVGYEVFLGLYEYPEIVFIESVFARDTTVTSRLSYSTKPLLTSHTGRLLASFYPMVLQDQLFVEQDDLLQLAGVTAAGLREELHRCHRDRFTAFDKTEDGAPGGIAVPIMGRSELPVASITITRQRGLDRQFLDAVLPRAQDTARRISSALGSRGNSSVQHI
jgi:IclR family pca regulon transcriptional regulator